MFEEKLKNLKSKISIYANLIIEMIVKSLDGLLNKSDDWSFETIKQLEDKSNQMEIELDEECINILARYRPEAKNLRIVLMASKIVTDLERMGDMAMNIADSVSYLKDKPLVKPLIDLPRMKDKTLDMINDSIQSFINGDSMKAMSVLPRDNEVDALRDQILRELITYMLSDSSTIERSMHLLRIARNLERIADLTTNISEDVIYMEEGKVIKHQKKF